MEPRGWTAMLRDIWECSRMFRDTWDAHGCSGMESQGCSGIFGDAQGHSGMDRDIWRCSGRLRDGHSGISGLHRDGLSGMLGTAQGYSGMHVQGCSGMLGDSQGCSGMQPPPSPAPFPPALPRTNEEQSQEALINPSPPPRVVSQDAWSLLEQPNPICRCGRSAGGTEIPAREAGMDPVGSPRNCPRRGRWPPAA